MISAYLPSTTFVSIAASLALAAGLVVTAQHITKESNPGSVAVATAPQDPNWEETLNEIQLASGVSAPEPASPAAVSELLEAAQNSSVTESVGRSLFVKLSSMGAEGLGSDIPTQEALVAEAAAKIGATMSASYTIADLVRLPYNTDSLHNYSNDLITILISHNDAQVGAVLFAFGETLDYQEKGRLAPVQKAAEAYAALADDVVQLPVPETLAPLHLSLANNLATVAKAAKEMSTVLDDPLRGLGGMSTFQAASSEAARLLTTIGKIVEESGILFSNDEPGAAWRSLVAPTTPT